MITDILIWLYLINALLLINHEIDSAYWKEWKLFNLKGGMNGFLAFNFIAIFIFLYGFIEIIRASNLAIIFSFLMALTGIFTFGIHSYFLAKGKPEFKVPFSLFILISTLIVSLIELIVVLISVF
ncbi:MAG: hypothetical protein Q8L27_03800 [archaeon]|nr:hypothetical protein [archaeon]